MEYYSGDHSSYYIEDDYEEEYCTMCGESHSIQNCYLFQPSDSYTYYEEPRYEPPKPCFDWNTYPSNSHEPPTIIPEAESLIQSLKNLERLIRESRIKEETICNKEVIIEEVKMEGQISEELTHEPTDERGESENGNFEKESTFQEINIFF